MTRTGLMRPIDATANLCGMRLSDPLVVHGVHGIDDDTLAACGARYRAMLAGEELPAIS